MEKYNTFQQIEFNRITLDLRAIGIRVICGFESPQRCVQKFVIPIKSKIISITHL